MTAMMAMLMGGEEDAAAAQQRRQRQSNNPIEQQEQQHGEEELHSNQYNSSSRSSGGSSNQHYHHHKQIPYLRYSLAVLLFLAISAQGQEINPNYDNPETKLKVFEIKNPLVLFCRVKETNSNIKHELDWARNGVDVKSEPQLAGRYHILKEEYKLVIDRALDGDAGNYTCTIKGTQVSASFRVIANVASKLPSNSAVVEEEKLTLHCIVVGTDPVIRWTIHDKITIKESMDRYTLMEDDNKIKNAILVINEAVLTDRGNFTCEVENEASQSVPQFSPSMSTTYVRVKGKFAALWPFLGICAEVFLLCAVILIYEKRRNKAEPEESDTDQSPEQKTDLKESEVRQRK